MILISKEKPDLSTFLCPQGNPNCWEKADFEKQLTDVEWESVLYFQFRAIDFLENIEDLNLPRLRSLSGTFEDGRRKFRSGIYPGRHRAKSVYLDFRHFFANDEPSNFYKILKLVSKKVDKDSDAHEFYAGLREKYAKWLTKRLDKNDRNFSNEHIITTWFYTEYFHAGRKDQRQKRDDILAAFFDESIQEKLFWEVVHVEHLIKTLYASLRDLEKASKTTVYYPPKQI
jgi:hypothetical protein